jgi:hypothetical protein
MSISIFISILISIYIGIHINIICIYIYLCICCCFKRKTEAHAIFPNLLTVCSSCKRKFFVCPFVNGINGLAHLCLKIYTGFLCAIVIWFKGLEIYLLFNMSIIWLATVCKLFSHHMTTQKHTPIITMFSHSKIVRTITILKEWHKIVLFWNI